MIAYAVRRIAGTILVLFAVSVLVFLIFVVAAAEIAIAIPIVLLLVTYVREPERSSGAAARSVRSRSQHRAERLNRSKERRQCGPHDWKSTSTS